MGAIRASLVLSLLQTTSAVPLPAHRVFWSAFYKHLFRLSTTNRILELEVKQAEFWILDSEGMSEVLGTRG